MWDDISHEDIQNHLKCLLLAFLCLHILQNEALKQRSPCSQEVITLDSILLMLPWFFLLCYLFQITAAVLELEY